MANKDEIRNIIELFIAWNGETEPIDVANIDSAVEFIGSSLQAKPKFKTGDRIKPVDSCLGSSRTIVDVCDSWYVTNQGTLDFGFEDNWELVEEPVSEDLEEVSKKYALNNTPWDDCADEMQEAFKAGAKWQKNHLWKPADGDDLPEIDREVIALLDNGKVVFAHRPPEYWDGKDIVTGKVTRNYPKTYDKGGWNIPDVKYWLDCSMLKEIEL